MKHVDNDLIPTRGYFTKYLGKKYYDPPPKRLRGQFQCLPLK